MCFARQLPLLLLGFASLAVAAPPVPRPGPATDSLANSRLAANLAPAWNLTSEDLLGSGDIELLKGGGVRLTKEMCGHRTLTQEVNLTTADLDFAVLARFSASSTKPDYYSYAAVVLTFLDSAGKPLGSTSTGYATAAAGWNNTPTAHYVRAAKPDTDAYYQLNLSNELSRNLTGIDPTRVKRLRVQFVTYCSGEDVC
jgi:hypothetical protein